MLRQKQRHGIVLDGVLLALGVLGIVVEDAGAAGLGVLFAHVLKLADDDLADARRARKRILKVFDLRLERCRLLHALQDILAVDIAQLDLGDVFRLDLVDAEADHQVRHDVGLLLRLADDLDGLVDIEQDLFKAL